jgi:NAD(P)-dependent dehydrogenase (short-subunit alcohol dehydrogenase family)
MHRTILITGATGVLGKLVAKTFAEQGHNLVLFGRETSHLDSLVRDLNLPKERVLTQTVDLINRQAVQDSAEAVHSKFGSVHALIHLVGGWLGGKTFTETSEEEFDSMFDQHVRTTFNLFHSFSLSLAAGGWGRVIIVSASTVANPPAKRGVYLAAKAAQENMVLSLAAELKDSGVTANIIQVRAVDVDNKGTGATPQEIVSAMLYLFSEEASKVNGARIPLY